MKDERYDTNTIVALLKRQKIATLDELKEALGTEVDITAFRKLGRLGYHTSYSHRGRYYTLREIAQFDELGLWSFRHVWFSEHGTLVLTAEACVNASEAGYFSRELENILHVDPKDALRKLVQEGRLSRERVGGHYLYCSRDADLRREQLRARQVYESDLSLALQVGGGIRILPDELKAAIILFFSLLDEKQRRLYAGLESLKIGHGGDQRIAELLNLDVGTVAKGRKQLLDRDIELDRVRKSGGGRPMLEKKRQRSSEESKN
jgi:hypothetical protein